MGKTWGLEQAEARLSGLGRALSSPGRVGDWGEVSEWVRARLSEMGPAQRGPGRVQVSGLRCLSGLGRVQRGPGRVWLVMVTVREGKGIKWAGA